MTVFEGKVGLTRLADLSIGPVEYLDLAPMMLEAETSSFTSYAPVFDEGLRKARMKNVAKPKTMISYEDFQKIDVRVGTILSVDDVPTSRKLVKLTVDLGFEVRTVITGMKQERIDPKEIEGSQALFVINLGPKKMAGELSEAMIFDIGYSDGIVPALAIPERAVPNGAQLG